MGDDEKDTKKEKVAFVPPWKMESLGLDEHGFFRNKYDFDFTLPNGDKTIIFTDNEDTFDVPGEGVMLVDKTINGIVNYLQSQGVETPDELTDKSKVWPEGKRKIIEAMTAASLYDQNGKEKTLDDKEGPALLLATLVLKKSNPELSSQCLEQLLSRASFLPKEESREVDLSNLVLGEIPIEKVWVTHSTNYLPEIIGGSAKVFPRIDTDGAERTTIHTYVNGMVENHDVGGIVTGSFDERKYMLGARFDQLVKDNGLPANFFRADTYWSLEPGTGLSVPEGSFLIGPKSESDKLLSLKELGIEVVMYDPELESLSQAQEKYFKEKEIPLISGVSANTPDNIDRSFASKLGVPAIHHFGHTQYIYSEELLLAASDRIQLGKVLATESGNIADKADDLCYKDISWATQIAPLPKMRALGIAVGLNSLMVRKLNSDIKMPREYLTTAYISNLL